MKAFFQLLLILIITSCTNNDAPASDEAPKSSVINLSHTIAAVYPHDTSSYTQGLVFYKGQMLEGTGNHGKSKLMQIDLTTGKNMKGISLDSTYFGEGITVLRDTLYQLTYTEKVVFVYSAKDFRKIKEFTINTEGWGITNDGKSLIVSDGSSNLYFYDPATFQLLRTQSVTEDGTLAPNLNELEYINGFIYANQYRYNYIFKIDPASGQIVAKLDLAELATRAKAKNPATDVLNGIAYNPDTKKIYITGKWWPELYEIQFEH